MCTKFPFRHIFSRQSTVFSLSSTKSKAHRMAEYEWICLYPFCWITILCSAQTLSNLCSAVGSTLRVSSTVFFHIIYIFLYSFFFLTRCTRNEQLIHRERYFVIFHVFVSGFISVPYFISYSVALDLDSGVSIYIVAPLFAAKHFSRPPISMKIIFWRGWMKNNVSR